MAGKGLGQWFVDCANVFRSIRAGLQSSRIDHQENRKNLLPSRIPEESKSGRDRSSCLLFDRSTLPGVRPASSGRGGSDALEDQSERRPISASLKACDNA